MWMSLRNLCARRWEPSVNWNSHVVVLLEWICRILFHWITKETILVQKSNKLSNPLNETNSSSDFKSDYLHCSDNALTKLITVIMKLNKRREHLTGTDEILFLRSHNGKRMTAFSLAHTMSIVHRPRRAWHEKWPKWPGKRSIRAIHKIWIRLTFISPVDVRKWTKGEIDAVRKMVCPLFGFGIGCDGTRIAQKPTTKPAM